MHEVQAALMSQDRKQLQTAIRNAKRVELQSRLPDGESVMAAANEVIGAELASAENANVIPVKTLTEIETLRKRISSLEDEVEELKKEKKKKKGLFLYTTA